MKNSVAIIFLLTISVCIFAGGTQEESNVDIRYGGQLYPGEFLLKGYDFFSEQNLLVEHTLFSSGTENNEALISGNVDVNVGSDSKSVALFNAMGEDVVIIGTVQRGNRYSTMTKKGSNYQNWYDLKGKVVGTRFGTGAEFVLRKYFDSVSDLSWDNFEWINLKTEDMLAALDNEQIEAFTVWAPTGEIAESMDIGQLLMNYGDYALTPVSIHTTKRFLENNREKLIQFLVAQLNKQIMIETDTAKAASIAATAASEMNMNISEDAFKLIFNRINFQINFDPILMDELVNTAQFLKDQGKIDSIPNFYYDDSLVKEAMEIVNN